MRKFLKIISVLFIIITTTACAYIKKNVEKTEIITDEKIYFDNLKVILTEYEENTKITSINAVDYSSNLSNDEFLQKYCNSLQKMSQDLLKINELHCPESILHLHSNILNNINIIAQKQDMLAFVYMQNENLLENKDQIEQIKNDMTLQIDNLGENLKILISNLNIN